MGKEVKRAAIIIIVNQIIMWLFFIAVAWVCVLSFDDNRNALGILAGYIVVPAVFVILMWLWEANLLGLSIYFQLLWQ